MSESGLDFNTQTEIFRHDNKVLIARNRHLASLMGVRLKYDAAGYDMGQVLALNTVTNIHEKYIDGEASGIGTAVGILYCDVPAASDGSSTDVAQMLVKGEVFEANCTDLDAAAKVDLGGRSVYDSTTGKTIFIF